jgi:glucan phosphoethanolaminetransferase (alkaline phosphatase superfamily)
MSNLPPRSNSFFFASQAGCLLPFFIVFNLLFGWMFFKPLPWLLIEVILILSFILTVRIAMSKVFSPPSKRDNVIDIEGQVVEEKKKLK